MGGTQGGTGVRAVGRKRCSLVGQERCVESEQNSQEAWARAGPWQILAGDSPGGQKAQSCAWLSVSLKSGPLGTVSGISSTGTCGLPRGRLPSSTPLARSPTPARRTVTLRLPRPGDSAACPRAGPVPPAKAKFLPIYSSFLANIAVFLSSKTHWLPYFFSLNREERSC